MKTIYDVILSLPMFQGIERLKLVNVLEKINLHFEKYHKDELITRKGEECTRLIFLLKGSVVCETVDKSGKLSIYEKIKKQTVLYPSFLFGKETRYPVTIKASEAVSTMSIDKSQVFFLLQSEPLFLLNFLNIISNKTQSLLDKILSLSGTDLKKNLAFFILSFTEKGSFDICIKSSQQDLADFFGVARPSLLKTINELRGAGIIEYKRKEITVLDILKLHDILHT
ncbi:MAG: Crp/Fnr family transcriptional regulator [Candidatus Azobacteroides sp.]|nr:Crp/Fnr family transcriptional regulator [Candidatus Azobacteroides sp.]